MLMQSHEGFISLLPATSKALSGSFSGLKARGNVEVSAKFSGGRAESFELVSAEDKCIKVEIKDAATVSCGGKEYNAVDGLFELCAKAGEKLECTVMY